MIEAQFPYQIQTQKGPHSNCISNYGGPNINFHYFIVFSPPQRFYFKRNENAITLYHPADVQISVMDLLPATDQSERIH